MYNIIIREEKLVGDLETWNFLFLLLHFSFVKSTERVYRFQFSFSLYVIFFFMDKGRKKLVLLMNRLTDWF